MAPKRPSNREFFKKLQFALVTFLESHKIQDGMDCPAVAALSMEAYIKHCARPWKAAYSAYKRAAPDSAERFIFLDRLSRSQSERLKRRGPLYFSAGRLVWEKIEKINRLLPRRPVEYIDMAIETTQYRLVNTPEALSTLYLNVNRAL